MTERKPEGDGSAKLTGVGCALTVLTVVVIFGVAIPIVQWRDAATGQPLPRMVAILAPFMVGAIFHGICTVLLRLVGLRTELKSDTEESRSLEG